ncbi:MAG: TetR/AcrR family transcriptional regulator [Chloroflexi bacterium]|nr:TetR/AcrR family transcriptional regulator [Chloroflexota bacterium]
MNGHDRRRQRISERIKKVALELYKSFGVEKVSMDEIAARADVSKVTIYKYFHSKAGLRREVIRLYTDEILEEIEKALEDNHNIVEKLKIIMLAEANAPKLADSRGLIELLEKDDQNDGGGPGILQNRIREILFRVYQEGIQEGYIDAGLSFELLNLYAEIIQAGFKGKVMDLQPVLADPQSFEKLLHLYFFGIFQKK